MKRPRTPLEEELIKESVMNEKIPPARSTPRTRHMEDVLGERNVAFMFEEQKHEQFFGPSIDSQLSTPGSSLTGYSIMEEITSDWLLKKLAPFGEGEPIGVLPRRVRSKRVTDAEVRKAYNRKKEDERDAMLLLRVRNNNTMKSILEAM